MSLFSYSCFSFYYLTYVFHMYFWVHNVLSIIFIYYLFNKNKDKIKKKLRSEWTCNIVHMYVGHTLAPMSSKSGVR